MLSTLVLVVALAYARKPYEINIINFANAELVSYFTLKYFICAIILRASYSRFFIDFCIEFFESKFKDVEH